MQSLFLDEIGPVRLRRSRRARRLRITVKPHQDVTVTLPMGCSSKQAVRFIEAKRQWIRRQQYAVRKMESQHRRMAPALKKIDRSAAREQLVNQLQQLASRYGYHYNRVFIRCQKTRWGSCSAKNNINLNLRLILLPAHLREYVILHELVHTRIKDHSRRFWMALDQHTGHAKALQRELRNYQAWLL